MYQQNRNLPLSLICHPYLFALKEGRGINADMMDYSLLLLQRNCTEVIPSPKAKSRRKKKPNLYALAQKKIFQKLST